MLLSDTVEISRAPGCNLYITYMNFINVYQLNTKNPFWNFFLIIIQKTNFYVTKINWSWSRKKGLDQCTRSKVSNIIYQSKAYCFKNWGRGDRLLFEKINFLMEYEFPKIRVWGGVKWHIRNCCNKLAKNIHYCYTCILIGENWL